MAVGDTVSGFSAAGSAMAFQPAAGVSVMITFAGIDNGNTTGLPYMTNNGTHYTAPRSSFSQTSCDLGNMKMIVDNTNYLYFQNLGAGKYTSYSGIVIK